MTGLAIKAREADLVEDHSMNVRAPQGRMSPPSAFVWCDLHCLQHTTWQSSLSLCLLCTVCDAGRDLKHQGVFVSVLLGRSASGPRWVQPPSHRQQNCARKEQRWRHCEKLPACLRQADPSWIKMYRRHFFATPVLAHGDSACPHVLHSLLSYSAWTLGRGSACKLLY